MPVTPEKYNVSFRCFFDNDGDPHYTTHYCPAFPIADIPRWLDAYSFTHPNCTSVTAKIWFVNGVGYDQSQDDED